MTDKQPEALRLANVCSNLTRYSMDAHLIAAELLRQHAENETLRAGYAAARLEIESLKAQQPGAVYAELPEPHHRGPAGTGNYFSSFTADQMRAFADATCAMRASHGQAPAQPAPQQEAQEPVAWQSRTRPTWGGNDRPWSPWEPCTKGLAEDCWKTPLLHEWAYEARALYTAPQPSPAAQGDALDAARYRWLAASCRSTSEHWGGRWSIIIDGPAPKSHDSEDDFDAAIDAARAAQEGEK